MLKDITLGQYFPGDTPVHRLDPRTKLLLVVVYIIALFSAKYLISYGLLLAALFGVILVSRINLKVILKSLKPLLFIIILTALLNLFTRRVSLLFVFGSLPLQKKVSAARCLWRFAFPC